MNIIETIHQELKQNIDQKYKQSEARLFKESRKVYGVSTPIVRNIGKKYWKEIKNKNKENVFRLSEELLSSGYHEPLIIAFQWASTCRKQYEKSDFGIFEKWLGKYVNNWSSCDDFCGGPLGSLVSDFPELLPQVFQWTKSKNRWIRRASSVCLIYSLRRGKCLEEAFKTADNLLLDQDDLVQKGYGWMLKEASNKFQKEVFEYVMRNKKNMTRIALRYAIEKLPDGMKKQAMC